MNKTKAILMSINPEWLIKIIKGEKTLEIRKTMPKIKTPFKVYLYCTKNGDLSGLSTEDQKLIEGYKGKVVAEFVCDEISVVECSSEAYKRYAKESCLTQDDFIAYCNGQDLYAWHITDLVVYNKPKDLSDFYRKCETLSCDYCKYLKYQSVNSDEMDYDCSVNETISITRPPQSWCYVEELAA